MSKLKRSPDDHKRFWKKLKEELHKNRYILLVYITIFVVLYILLLKYFPKPVEPEEVTYKEFLEYLYNGDIDTVYYNKNSELMKFTLFNDETRQMSIEDRQNYDYDNDSIKQCKYPNYQEFAKDVLENGSNIKSLNATSSISQVTSSLISLTVWIFFFILILRTLGGKGLSEKDLIQTSDVTFDDIKGQDEVIDDIKFYAKLIKDPTIGDKIGVKMPKGLLFEGPPGTGKTMIAKAIANEAGVTFLYQKSSAFIEMFVGVGAKRVRDLFRIARKHAPCIIFMDEIDSIGLKRGNNHGTSEHEQTINQLLQEMDGFQGHEGIFIIAATNRADELDEALVRPGRFDRRIAVNPPHDWLIRKELLIKYLSKYKVDKNIDIDSISKQLSGFTGAHIAAMCNEAGIKALKYGKEEIDQDCIEEAIDQIWFKGNRSKREPQEEDKNIVAYHEAGHAIMSMLLGEPIARASIKPTTSGVGGAVANEDKETQFMSDNDLKNRILVAYAGRASEEIKFNRITTGASNDITQATKIMVQYIEKLGFDKEFGLLDVSVLAKEHIINGDKLTEKLSKMSLQLYEECTKLLRENYDKVERLAIKLLEVGALSGEEIRTLFQDVTFNNKDEI